MQTLPGLWRLRNRRRCWLPCSPDRCSNPSQSTHGARSMTAASAHAQVAGHLLIRVAGCAMRCAELLQEGDWAVATAAARGLQAIIQRAQVSVCLCPVQQTPRLACVSAKSVICRPEWTTLCLLSCC